ncbi:MAG: ribonuclease P protein component [Chitinophagaceae bacterium]|nr:ribonuclease P protein component [Chitinophagaceae bacterium]
MAGIYTLSKQERIRGRKLLEELFSKGIRLNQGPFRVVILDMAEPGLKLGVGASVRHYKRSVDRNRIKRLLREAFRLNKLTLRDTLLSKGKGLLVFISYASREKPDFPQVEKAVKTILFKLAQRANENPASTT